MAVIDPNISPIDLKIMQNLHKVVRLREECLKEQTNHYGNKEKMLEYHNVCEQLTSEHVKLYTSLSPLGKDQYDLWKAYELPLPELNRKGVQRPKSVYQRLHETLLSGIPFE